MKTKSQLIILFIFLFLAPLAASTTDTYTWTGTSSTSWNNTDNWSTATVPDSESISVYIPSGTDYSPLLDMAASVLNLTIESGAELDLAGYDFTVAGTHSSSGTLILQGDESVSFENGIDTDSGTIEYTGDGTTGLLLGDTYYDLIFSDGDWDLNNTLTISNDLSITSDSSVVISEYSLNVSGDLTLTGELGSSGSTGDISVAGTSSLGGDITTNAGAITFTGALTATDSVNISTGDSSAGDILFDSTVLDDGSGYDLTIDSGTGSVSFSDEIGGTDNLNSLSITCDDTLSLPVTTLVDELTVNCLGALTQTGILSASAVTLTTDGGVTLDQSNEFSSLEITNTTGGDIEVDNELDLSITGITQVTGSDISIENSGNITLDGDLYAGTGSVTIDALGDSIYDGDGSITADTMYLQTNGSSSGFIGTSVNNIETHSSSETGTTTLSIGGGSLMSTYIDHLTGNLTVIAISLDSATVGLSLSAAEVLTLPTTSISVDDLSLISSGGALAILSGGDLTATDELILTAGDGDLSFNDLISCSGTMTLNSSANVTDGDSGYLSNFDGTTTISTGDSSAITLDHTSNDIADLTIDSSNNDVTLDYSNDTTLSSGTSQTLGSLTLSPVYSATFTLGSNLDIDGNLNLAGGTLDVDAVENYQINLAGDWENSAGTFNEQNGLVIFDGTGTISGETFYDMEIEATGTYTLEGILDIDNDLTLSSGILDVDSTNNYKLYIGNDWINSGGTFTEQSGEVEFDGADGSTSGTETFYDVTVSGSLTLGEDLDVDRDLNITGTLDVSTISYEITIVGDFSNSGTYSAQEGTVTFDGSDQTGSISAGGTGTGQDFYNLVINDGGGTASTYTLGSETLVSNDLTITDGTLDTSTYDLQVTGSTATVSSSGTLDFSSSLSGNSLDMDADLDVEGSLLGGLGTIEASGFVDFTDGSFTKDSGLFEFNASSSEDLTTNSQDLGDIEVSGSLALTDSGDFDDVTVSGTFTTDQSFSIAGDWSDSGSVTISSGTVTFDNEGDQAFTSDGDSFYSIQIGDDTNNSLMTMNNDLAVDGNLAFGTGGTSTLDFTDLTITIGGDGDFTNAQTLTSSDTSLVEFNAADDQDFTSAGFTFTDVIKSGSDTLNVIGELTISDTLTVSTGTTVDLQGYNFSIETLENDGVLELEGTQTITTMDTDSGEVEYSGSSGGTVMLDSFYDLLIDGAGTFDLTSAINVNNDLEIAGGELDVTTSNFQITIDGDWTNSDTFTAQEGRVLFNGTTTMTTTDTSPFYNVSLGTEGSGSLTTGSQMEIEGLFTIGDADTTELDLSDDTLIIEGDLDFSYLETFTSTGSTVQFDGSADQNLTSSEHSFNNITLTGGSSLTLMDSLDLDGDLTVSDGTLIDNGFTHSFAGDVDFTGGDFDSTGTIVFDGDSILTSSGETFNNVSLGTTDAGSLTTADQMSVEGVFTIGDGGTTELDLSDDTLIIAGDLDLSELDTFTSTGSTVQFDGSADQDLTSSGHTFNNVTLTGLSLTLNDDVELDGSLLVSTGTFLNNDQTVTFAGSGTITSNSSPFYDVVISGSTYNLGDNMEIDEKLTISGTFEPGDHQINYNGTAWTTTGTFDHTVSAGDDSLVEFTNEGTITISGDNTFYDFDYEIAGGTILFGEGDTQFIDHDMTVIGELDDEIILESTDSDTPTQWILEINFPESATATFQYVNIKNS